MNGLMAEYSFLVNFVKKLIFGYVAIVSGLVTKEYIILRICGVEYVCMYVCCLCEEIDELCTHLCWFCEGMVVGHTFMLIS